MHGEREPERQAAGAAGQADRVVGRVPLGGLGEHVEVAGVLGVRGPGQRRVAVEQGAAVERREEPLVRVDDERVRSARCRRRARAPTGRRAPAPPYAPSTWNHSPNSRHTSRDRGEVVDDRRSSSCRLVATTAKNVSGPWSSKHLPQRRRRSAATRSSTGTPTSSASMTSHADWIDEWAPSVAATRHGRAPPACRRLAPARCAGPRRAPTGCRSCRRGRRRRRPRPAARRGRRSSAAPGSRRRPRPEPSSHEPP